MHENAIRIIAAATRIDTFQVRIYEAKSGRLFGEIVGNKQPFHLPERFASPVWRDDFPREQAISALITDGLNQVIGRAGPIVSINSIFE